VRYEAHGPAILRDGKPFATICADAPEHMEASHLLAGILAALLEIKHRDVLQDNPPIAVREQTE
jgi:hypothetical protein